MSLEIGSPCGPAGVIWEDGRCLPVSILDPDPIAVWVFDTLCPIIASIFVIYILYRCIQLKTLNWAFLIAIASATTWWQESFGDWGQHLLYTPVLKHYTLDWWYTAPHNPVFMPVVYAIYWCAHAWAILALVKWVKKKFLPHISTGQGILLLSIPMTWMWNLANEGPATYFGLWTYDPPIGPSFLWPRGTYWSFLWPSMLMVGWINIIAWMVGHPEEQHEFNRLERFFCLHRLIQCKGWVKVSVLGQGEVLDPMQGAFKFQIMRLFCWAVFFNISFFLTLILPLYLMRVVPGFHSFYLPMPW